MDFITLRQSDYSGGVNLMDDPVELKENEFADCRNIRLKSKNKIEQRLGYTEYNGTTIGASTEVRSLFHFQGYDETWIPLAQAGNNLYKGDTAWPGTGGTWSRRAG